MRLDDASYLVVENALQNTTLVLPEIPPGKLSILSIEPEDSLAMVLATLGQHAQPVIIVLPERSQVFSEPEHFARLQQVPAPEIISFVAPSTSIAAVARLAHGYGFSVTSSLEWAKALFMQRTAPAQRDQPMHHTSAAYAMTDEQPVQAAGPTLPDSTGQQQVAQPSHGTIPKAFASPFQQRPGRKQFMLIALTSAILVVAAAVLLPLILGQPGTLTTTLHQAPAAGTPVGSLAFSSSGQLDPQSTKGLNDIVTLDLHNLTPPAPGGSYYAWLLADRAQDEVTPILLGKLAVAGGKAQLMYTQPDHSDLLATYSRLLVTEQGNNEAPSTPSLDQSTWHYEGGVPNIPTPGDENGFSLLSHLRHLLASDPTVASIGLAGGLDIWLYRNAGKILEWSNAARDDWAVSGDAALDGMRNMIYRVVEYMDGIAYAWRELPPGAPWLVDPKAGRLGLLDFIQNQNPPGYLTHIHIHLMGLINSPGHTPQEQQFAKIIDKALNGVTALMRKIHADAVELAKMDDGQLQQPGALSLLDDMYTNANYAYVGRQIDPTTGGVQGGVVSIYDELQQLATIQVTTPTANGP